MASLMARLVGSILRTTGVYRKRYSAGAGFEERIAASRVNPFLPNASMRSRLSIAQRDLNGRAIWTVAPKGGAAVAHILYFHGGGYVYPAIDAHWKYIAHMAEKHRVAFTVPLYPLAPEAQAEETIRWAMEAYRDFLAQHDGSFILGGDSAGGGLASVVAQMAAASGMRQANGLLLICPWLDLAMNHPQQPAIEPRDCILTLAGARLAGEVYAGPLPVSDPKVSPLLGVWDGLPPVMLFGGGDDILLPDARRLAALLPNATYIEGADLMHDWPLFTFRESRAAQADMAAFAGTQCQ